MASMKEICSVSDFISNLRTLRENSTETIRFFRGHGDSGYKLEPSIYRHPSWIENENRIINDALVNCPFDFESNPTNFDKLVNATTVEEVLEIFNGHQNFIDYHAKEQVINDILEFLIE